MSKVELQSPENAQTGVSGSGPLTWNAVEGYDRYRVEVALRDSELTAGEEFDVQGALIDRIVFETSLTIDPPLSLDTEYVWRVRAARVKVIEPDPEVLGVTVSPPSATVNVGSTIQFFPNVQTVGDASTAVTWESSDESAMTVNSNGLGTAHSEQTPTITARSVFDPTKTGTSSITIVEQSTVIDSRAGDEAALQDLFSETTGANWINKTGWAASGMSLDNTIYGVEVSGSGSNRRVVSIDLMSNNLVGTLSNSLGNLKKCKWFNVKDNFLTGQIAASIGNITDLEYLYLGGDVRMPPLDSPTNGYHPGKKSPETNTYAGSVLPPEFGQLSNLKILQISQTQVGGTLPPEWGSLSNLERLLLDGHEDGNQGELTGTLPPEWGGMTSLLQLTLNGNKGLGGTLPASWGAIPMRHFRLNDVYMAGSIPPEWEAWGPLLRLFLINGNYGNSPNGQLSGTIPAWLLDDRTPVMHTLILNGNNFSAMEAVNPANVERNALGVFNPHSNAIVAPFPNYLKGQFRMQIFYLYNYAGAGTNQFTGPIDDDFFQGWYRLRNINLSGQSIGGSLPSSFGNSSSTSSSQRLEFNSAGFTGKIPESWGGYQSEGINWMYMHGNDLYGLIPVGMAGWAWNSGQNGLRLHSNRFTYSDIIPLLNAWPSGIPLTYGTQKPFPVDDYINPSQSGSSITLDLSGIDIAGNVYQWRRNGNNISNGTGISGATSHTLELSGAGVVAGEYTLRITNVNAPDLSESISQPITVS